MPDGGVNCAKYKLDLLAGPCLVSILSWVNPLCPGALRAGLLRAAWRTALCAWRWRKAGGFLPHTSFVFSKRKLQKLCVGRWGPVSL